MCNTEPKHRSAPVKRKHFDRIEGLDIENQVNR